MATELDTDVEFRVRRKFDVKPNSVARQGYRIFECDNCHLRVQWPTRDCLSPSVETCPECRTYMRPLGYTIRSDWPVDKQGNLLREEDL